MKRFQFTFNGTGADVYLCFGFIPDHVLIIPIGSAADAVTTGVELEARMEWWRKGAMFASTVGSEKAIGKGVFSYTSGGNVLRANKVVADSDGITEFPGGTIMTSTNQTSVTFGEGIYLAPFFPDMRYGPTHGKSYYDSVSAVINQWALDTAANRTGHFNEDVTGTYIGAGSMIKIDGVEYFIQALTAGAGEAADEVTLSSAAATGQIEYIGPKWTTRPIPIGQIAGAGIKLESATGLNTDGETHLVIATMYDNR